MVQKNGNPSNGSSKNLLFLTIDDDEDIGECIGFAVSLTEHKTEYFNNPLRALEAFKKDQGKYHAIFTDLLMPEMSGEKVIEEVRRLNKVIPIIIITATGGIFTTDDLVKLNIPSIIAKPFELSDIELAVKQVEERYATARAL